MKKMLQLFLRATLSFALIACAVLSVCATRAVCFSPPAGLVSWWPGEGGANDIIGTNPGTLSATGASYVAGKVGQGFRFDGTNGYVQIPDSASLKPANITVEAWVWLDPSITNAHAEQIVFKKNTWNAFFEGYSLLKEYVDNGNGTFTSRFSFVVTRSGSQIITRSTTAVSRGVWYHVAATYDGNTQKLFVNGVLEASAFAGFALDYDTLPIFIGSTGIPGNYVNYLGGIIDEPSIYNRALTTNEIVSIYNAGNAGKCNTSATAAPTIINQPANLVVALNGAGTFSVTAQGTAPLEYQWKFNGINLAGATSSNLNLTSIQSLQAGNYSVLVSNAVGTAISSNARLTVNVSATSCVSPASGVTAWWQGEGDVKDMINSNNGSVVGSISYTIGMVGQALVFDGGSYIAIPSSPSLNIGAFGSGVTIEGWIKPSGGGVGMPVVEWGSDSTIGLHLWVEAGYRLFANILDVSGVSHILFSANGAVSSNSFQHVALTYDKGSGLGILYLNGVQLLVQNVGNITPQTTYPLNLGLRGTTGEKYQGLLDELSLYNRALTANEIAAIYNAGGAGKCSPLAFAASPVPSITSFAPTSATNGAVVTIAGTNYNPNVASNIVYFGAVKADVLYAASNYLTVMVPAGATFAPLSVTVGGLTAYSAKIFQPTFAGNGSNLVNGSFAPSFNLNAGNGPIPTLIADWDGDGKPDLATANYYDDTLSIFRNISTNGASLGAASFGPRFNLTFPTNGVGGGAYRIRAADLDGDGRLDLIAAEISGNRVCIFRNVATPGSLSSNSFAAPLVLIAGHDCRNVAAADLDGDGRVDLVALNLGDNTISIFKNVGTGTGLTTNSFAAPFTLATPSGPYEAAIADLDGDGKPDLSVVNHGANNVSVFQNVTAAGILNSSSFAPRFDLPCGTQPESIAAADLDGDGKLDLAVGAVQSDSVNIFRNLSSGGLLGTNSFASPVNFGTPGWMHSIAVADFNGDGKPDLGVVGELPSFMAVFQNTGTPGGFTSNSFAPRVDFGTGWNAWGINAGDLDGDGRPDVVFANQYDGTIQIYQNLTPFGAADTNGTSTNCTPLAGMVGWWKGDGNGTDQIAANNGTLANVAYTNGIVGQAFSFDPENYSYGTYTGVQIADQPAYALTNSLTIEGWVRPRGDGYMIFFRGDHRPGTDPFALSMNGSHELSFYIGDESGNYTNVISFLNYNQWTHVAATLDGASGAMRLYTNGVVAAQIITAVRPFGALQAGQSPGIGIGNLNDGGNNFPFYGDIDDISLYSRSLSAAEIQAIASAGSAGKCGLSVPAQFAPTIVAQTPNQVVLLGTSATFTVTATGTDPLNYFWKRNDAFIPNATNASYTLAAAQLADSGSRFTCLVSNAVGTASSTNALLKVIDTIYNDLCSGAVVITNYNSTNTQSTSHASSFGDPLPGCVNAFGNGVWYQFTAPINGLLIADTFGSDFDTGLAVYSGTCGALVAVDCDDDFNGLTSQVFVPTVAGATYFLLAGGFGGSAGNLILHTHYLTPPVFEVQPTNLAVITTSNASFATVVSGATPMNFQWYFNSLPLADDGRITGSTNSILNIAAVTLADDGNYQLLASNFLGASTSSIVHLLVMVPPSITLNPIGRSVPPGLPTTFTAAAAGIPAPTYQWQLNGTNISGATNVSYATAVTNEAIGFYHLVASNAAGIATSADAQLTYGPVAAWGRNLNNESLPPPNLSNVVSVAGAYQASFAVLTDGKVVRWGGSPATNVPASATNVVALALSGNTGHYALRADGTVVSWNGIAAPVTLSNIVQVAAGNNFGIALRAEGVVTGWGATPYSTVPAGLNNVKAIACGNQHTLALKNNGTVISWGAGPGTNVPAGLADITAIAAGYQYSLALRANGTVAAWGTGSLYTNLPAGLTNVAAIYASGPSYTPTASLNLAVRSNGTVVVWGDNSFAENVAPPALNNLISVAGAAAPQHGLALVNDGSPQILQPPVGLTAYSGRDLNLPARAAGAAPLSYQWLVNGTNILGATNSNLLLPNLQLADAGNYQLSASNFLGMALSVPAPVNVISNGSLVFLSPTTVSPTNLYQGGKFTAAVGTILGSGPLRYQWFFSPTNKNYAALSGLTNDTLTMDPAFAVQSGNYYVAVSNLVNGFTSAPVNVRVLFAKAWGFQAVSNPPVNVTNAIAVATGGYQNYYGHYFALGADGRLASWGNLSQGIYGETNVSALSNSIVTAIAAGPQQSLALKSDGTVYAWGYGGYGQTNPPANLSGVTAIAVGDYHDLALKADGTVVGWGAVGAANQVNYGQATNNPAATNVVAIAAGSRHSVALRADGTVVAWGYGSDGATTIPQNIGQIIAIAAGNGFSAALRTNGTVVQWGTGMTSYPVPVNLSNVVAISAASTHCTALKNDGSVVSWGYEYVGLASNNVPSDLANVIAIASGGDHDIALFGTRAPAFTVQPWNRSVTLVPNTIQTVTLVGKVAGVQPMNYQWRLNGTNVFRATNDSLSLRFDSQLNPSGTYQLVASNGYGVAVSKPAKVAILIPLAIALDTIDDKGVSPLAWLTSGGTPWYGETNITHDGIDAARSGGIGGSQETILQTILATNFAGRATFWWKTSSEQFFDALEFRVNGTVQASLSGEADWQLASIPVPAGTNLLQWRFSKDSSFDAGLDAGFVDQFTFVADPPAIIVQPFGLAARAGDNVALSVTAVGVPQLKYQWLKDGAAVGGNSPVLTLNNVSGLNSGNYSVTVTNLAGATTSSLATVRVVTPQLLGTPQLLADGSLQFTTSAGGSLTEADLPNFEAQASSDLVNWVTLPDALSLTNGALLLNDTTSTNFITRFYRLVEH